MAHVEAYFEHILTSEGLKPCDLHSGSRDKHGRELIECRPEHWRMVRSAETDDDSGEHCDTAAGMQPKMPQSCLHDLAARVTASRADSKAQRERKIRLRATFCIADIVAEHLNDGQKKRRGRPSNKQQNRRFSFSL